MLIYIYIYISRYAYPLLEDGVVVNSTLDLAFPTSVKQLNKVYTVHSKGGNQTYLGNYPVFMNQYSQNSPAILKVWSAIFLLSKLAEIFRILFRFQITK